MVGGYVRRFTAVLRPAQAVSLEVAAPSIVEVPVAHDYADIPILIVRSSMPPSSIVLRARYFYAGGVGEVECVKATSELRVCRVPVMGDAGYVEIHNLYVGVLARVAVVRLITLDVMCLDRGGLVG